jgi:hypothetical protein
LRVNLPLVVVPDTATLFGHHSLDRQESPHLFWFEDAALRIDERDAFSAELESAGELRRCQNFVNFAQAADRIKRGNSDSSIRVCRAAVEMAGNVLEFAQPEHCERSFA